MRGGYRQNAGRKKGFSAKNAEMAREVLSAMVMHEIEPIGKALIGKAKKGDVAAVRELFDRAFGKSRQGMDITSDSEVLTPPILRFRTVTGFNYLSPEGRSSDSIVHLPVELIEKHKLG